MMTKDPKLNRTSMAETLAGFSLDPSREILTIDSHTAGETTRLIVGGVGPVHGSTMGEKLDSFKKGFDGVRRMLTREPRGHRGILAAMVTEGTDDKTHFGLIYMDARRYPYLCGHATIGAVATLVQTGILQVTPGENAIVVDTPSGPMKARAMVKDNRTESVTITMVPAFVLKTGQALQVPGFGRIRVDLVCVGGFFAMVSLKEIGIELTSANTKTLADLGMAIIDAANDQLTVYHPLRPEVTTIDVTEFYDPDQDNALQGRNLVVYGESHVDRSPCGTGTTAKLALLHHHKKIRKGQVFTNVSPLGTVFQGTIVDETTLGDLDAVVVEIRGNAHITGVHRFMSDPQDPFPQGFLMP
ncbi:MAG: proline racemase family protein [Pseudomonadota bacterium]